MMVVTYICISMVALKYVAQCIIPYAGRKDILVWMERPDCGSCKQGNGTSYFKTYSCPGVDMHFMHG